MSKTFNRSPIDDAQLDRLLARASGSRAPDDLLPGLMSRIAAEEKTALAWWRQPLPTWPKPALAGGLAAVAATAAGLVHLATQPFASFSLPAWQPPGWLEALGSLRDVLMTTAGAVARLGLESLQSPIVLAAAAGLAACAMLSVGFGAATLRIALSQRP